MVVLESGNFYVLLIYLFAEMVYLLWTAVSGVDEL